MTGFPTPHVYLEDAAGAFTHDVSDYCRLTTGLSVARGRNDEQTDVTSGEAVLRLDNTDGRFTLGAPTYDGITVDKRLQYVETYDGVDYTRFTGYVQEWPTQWESGIANLAYATITVIDRQARLARRKLLAALTQEVLADGPALVYGFTESAGATAAGDSSGSGGPALTVTGTGDPLSFSQTGPNSDGSAVAFVGGEYLTSPGLDVLTADPQTWAVCLQRAESPAAVESVCGFGAYAATLSVLTDGRLSISFPATGVTSSVVVADSSWHDVVVTFAGHTATLYVDGVSQGSAAGTGFFTSASLTVGYSPTSAAGGFNGTVALVAGYDFVLSDPRIAVHAAAVSGFTSDTADQRVARLAGYANIATADQALEVGQQPSIAAQATHGVFALDAMRAAVAAEGGLLFISGDGKLTMHNKAHRVLTAAGTPGLTLTADQVDARSLTVAGDKNYLFNTGTGTGTGGAQQRIVNQASVDVFEEYDVQRDVALLPDALVLDQLQWITTMYGEPQARITSLQIDLFTLPTAVVHAALALEVGDRAELSALPVQSPAAALDLLVEGLKENLTESSWTLTLNTVPAALFHAPIYDDPTTATYDTGLPVYF